MGRVYEEPLRALVVAGHFEGGYYIDPGGFDMRYLAHIVSTVGKREAQLPDSSQSQTVVITTPARMALFAPNPRVLVGNGRVDAIVASD
jgi:hypothetical protein